ncbi:MAG: heparan-alpha-glucosaminide N-acetyltransferase domain-containing protein [Methylocella sp.]
MTQAIDLAGTPITEKVSPAPAAVAARLPGIDRMRGLVIVLMALDHVRDFFNVDALYFDPTDLTRTYPALFLTRFVTHYCAPTFVLLAGVSAFLHGRKLNDRGALARFLLTRGVWLILLDAIVVSPVWALELGRFHLATLWAIGCSMIALAGLVFLPLRAVLLIGVLIIVSHNLLDPLHAVQFGAWAPLWSILHEPGALPFGLPGGVSYPVLPWIGIMALGYGLGPVFLEPASTRAWQLTLLGLASIALFLLLRGTNFYGDPHPWSQQRDSMMTALSVLNVSKYPPSLLYALVTLGPALLLLPAMERFGGFAGEVLATFGRVPLFIYLLHLYAAHAAAVALFLAEGFDYDQLRGFGAQAAPPAGLGLSLPATYAAWILIMAALYPACRWFANVKRRRHDWWLSYL